MLTAEEPRQTTEQARMQECADTQEGLTHFANYSKLVASICFPFTIGVFCSVSRAVGVNTSPVVIR